MVAIPMSRVIVTPPLTLSKASNGMRATYAPSGKIAGARKAK